MVTTFVPEGKPAKSGPVHVEPSAFEAFVTGVGSSAAIAATGRITAAHIATRSHCFIAIPLIWKTDRTACGYGRTTTPSFLSAVVLSARSP
jgi:hypothetical protein